MLITDPIVNSSHPSTKIPIITSSTTVTTSSSTATTSSSTGSSSYSTSSTTATAVF